MGRIFGRSPIPIVNPLLKTVFVFGVQWGAQSYSDLPNYNTIKNNFRHCIPLLVMTCWKCGGKLNVGFERIIYGCSFDLIVDSHWCVLFIICWPKHINWILVMLPNSIILILFFLMLFLIKIRHCYLYISLADSKIVREIMINDT